LDDEKMIELMRSGDSEAFLNAMAKYKKLLWVIAGGILSNVGTHEDIEECVSDVYVHLWKNLKAFDPRKGSLKTYLAVIAKNKAIDKYRQLTKIQIMELNEAISSSDDDLFEYISRQGLFGELYDAIRSLEEPDKEILVRRFFFDETPSIISDKTTIPVKEVKNRLYQSKLRLRKILSEGDC